MRRSTHNYGASASVKSRVQHRIEVTPDVLEVIILLNALDEIIVAALVLDNVASFVREYPDLLMGFLSRASLGDDLHKDSFGNHLIIQISIC